MQSTFYSVMLGHNSVDVTDKVISLLASFMLSILSLLIYNAAASKILRYETLIR